MIQPIQQGEALLQDIEESSVNENELHIWWLGQSGFLIKWKDWRVLIDPYLSNSLTKKYALTDKPHIRMTEIPIEPRQLIDIDVLTSSHNHTDHLDAETLLPLIDVNPNAKMIIPEANRQFVANRLSCEESWPIGMVQGQTWQLTEHISITGVPAAHNDLDLDEHGRCLYMGYIFDFHGTTVYHSGDTLWHPTLVDELKKHEVDIAILPINGNLPERRVAGNLNAEEAVHLSRVINAKMLIPCHYHMFTFNTVDPDEFVELAEKHGQDFLAMQCGERFSLHTNAD